MPSILRIEDIDGAPHAHRAARRFRARRAGRKLQPRRSLSLGIGQPAVSSRIQGLEDELGGALFRRGRRISVTPLGESFLPYARRVLDVLHEGVESARMAQLGGRGRVKLGSLGSLSAGLVAPALARFNRTHPSVDCMLKSADHEVLVQMLVDGIVDLGVISIRI